MTSARRKRVARAGGREPDRAESIPQVFTKREAIDERLASHLTREERAELEFEDQLSFWDTHLGSAAEVV